ncbi:MAG: DUF3572 domain-containing protein [Xanthobacteraceae bacterium]|nr:DUF3572 domain-containing protein [Xanthobacteraceae bacterium]MBX3534307.1 DUF3572 domain-containing protein [Xanthobacteraceae bacterium]MCW5677458.1 DUF3572 domain-containing protein [Xanthobacteraceae bacterium]
MPISRGKSSLTKPEAEAIGIAGLSWLAADPERIGRFLAVTGLGPENVRAAAREPSFLPALLDYLLANETDLVAFAGEMNLDPVRVRAARDLLSPPVVL